MRPHHAILAVATLAFLLVPAVAAAETRRYVVAIGNNTPPPSSTPGDEDDTAATLHYADDDAASMAALGHDLGAATTLLTVFDADSQRRFPGLAPSARAPTLAELRRVVEELRRAFEADVRAGNEPTLIFFYSGHGVAKAGEPASLAMLDGALTRQILYDEVLAPLPARYVHLIIDACHAEAVVRPRDAQAEVSDVSDADLALYAARSTLRRFPQVGAILATTSAALAHEWDALQRGVFTYEVISAFHGAADVNRDGVIEYSELSAFITAANAEVIDPRARLSVLVQPPALNARAPLVDLSPLRARGATLIGPVLSRFLVEDARGNRLGELSPERGFRFEVFVPSREPLYVRSDDGEAEIQLEPGAKVALASIPMKTSAERARGSVEGSLRRGLFATPFGPSYYRGFVNGRPEMSAVSLPLGTDDWAASPSPDGPQPTRSMTPGIVALAGAGVFVVASVVATVVAVVAHGSYDKTDFERPASVAADRFYAGRAVAVGAGAGALALGGLGAWLVMRSSGPAGVGPMPAGATAGASATWVW
jgi:hypothetical protein